MNQIILGDCLIKLKELEDNSVDSIVTDPPAGIYFMGRAWDSDKGGRDHWIAWMQEVATECKRVLKPGGHAFVWAIPRTSHWTATAWENAGFEIRDVVAHIFGSGFPKSLNIGKAVDKLQGNEREFGGYGKLNPRDKKSYEPKAQNDIFDVNKGMKKLEITKGTSKFEGWGTALKPAREDWLLMRKPLSEKTVAENCLKWGTGGINIDESRVEIPENDKENYDFNNNGLSRMSRQEGEKLGQFDGGWKIDKTKRETPTGRFPANLIHDNSEEVRECFPETKHGGSTYNEGTNNNWLGSNKIKYVSKVKDSGNASRFFKSIIYQAKASKSERNKGCDGLEEKVRVRQGLAGEHKDTVSNNFHPTVKPIALMEYLIKMVTPKGGIVLDPFCGSGSTLVAAKQNGFQYIGIEMTEEYIPIIEARLNTITQQALL